MQILHFKRHHRGKLDDRRACPGSWPSVTLQSKFSPWEKKSPAFFLWADLLRHQLFTAIQQPGMWGWDLKQADEGAHCWKDRGAKCKATAIYCMIVQSVCSFSILSHLFHCCWQMEVRHLCHPWNFHQKSNSSLVLLVLFKYSPETEDLKRSAGFFIF